MSELSIKTSKGVFWNFIEFSGQQIITLVVSIILARILMPEQFGLIGLLAIFIAIAQSIMDSGFGSALIQKKDVTQIDENSIFFFNIVTGIVLVIILVFIAPLIATYFDEPLLLPLTRVLSFSVLINSFSQVQAIKLNKTLDFKSLMKVTLISSFISGTISIILALYGFGVWALAFQTIVASLVRAISLWLISKWRPAWTFSFDSLKSMFSFGSRIFLSGILDSIFFNIYQPLIGKLFSIQDVGYFDRARNLERISIQPAGLILGRVMFPALSTIQDEKTRMSSAVREILISTVFFHFPMMFGLICLAEPIILILLTDKWASSIPYFQILCLVGIIHPFQIINLNILRATGKSKLFLNLEVFNKITIILVIFITYRFGIKALLLGQLLSSSVNYFAGRYFISREINYPIFKQLADIAPYAIMSLVMAAVIYFVGSAIDSLWSKLILQVLVGLVVYFFLNFVFNQERLKNIWNILLHMISTQSTD